MQERHVGLFFVLLIGLVVQPPPSTTFTFFQLPQENTHVTRIHFEVKAIFQFPWINWRFYYWSLTITALPLHLEFLTLQRIRFALIPMNGTTSVEEFPCSPHWPHGSRPIDFQFGPALSVIYTVIVNSNTSRRPVPLRPAVPPSGIEGAKWGSERRPIYFFWPLFGISAKTAKTCRPLSAPPLSSYFFWPWQLIYWLGSHLDALSR